MLNLGTNKVCCCRFQDFSLKILENRYNMPTFRLGHLRKLKRAEVDEWVEAGCVADRNKKDSDE